MNAAQETFYRKLRLNETAFAEVTCLMVCAETMGTDILTAPAPTTMGLAVGH